MEERKNDQIILEKIDNLDIKMAKELEDTRLDILKKVNGSINNKVKHFEPSEKTLKYFNDVDKRFEAYQDKTSKELERHGADLREIKATLSGMTPSVTMLKNVAITGEVLTKVGKFILWMAVAGATIFGACYSFKDWIKKP